MRELWAKENSTHIFVAEVRASHDLTMSSPTCTAAGHDPSILTAAGLLPLEEKRYLLLKREVTSVSVNGSWLMVRGCCMLSPVRGRRSTTLMACMPPSYRGSELLHAAAGMRSGWMHKANPHANYIVSKRAR